jgi:hypothetical protein
METVVSEHIPGQDDPSPRTLEKLRWAISRLNERELQVLLERAQRMLEERRSEPDVQQGTH